MTPEELKHLEWKHNVMNEAARQRSPDADWLGPSIELTMSGDNCKIQILSADITSVENGDGSTIVTIKRRQYDHPVSYSVKESPERVEELITMGVDIS